MSKAMSVVGILALAAFLTCARTAEAQAEVPRIIARTLTEQGVPPSQVAAHYQAIVQTMATHSHVYVRSVAGGLADLERVLDPAARQQALRLAVDSCVQLRVAIAHRIILVRNSLVGMADPRPLLQALKDPAMWRQSVFTPLYSHVCNVATAMGIGGGATGAAATRLAGGSAAGAARGAARTKGGFVSLPILLSTVTAVVAGTGGYIKGKAMVERQHLQVQAAENETYVNALRVLIRSMRAGRAKLPKGLTLEKAADRIVRNIDAGLPPFANVLELKPAPDISGAWTGDLVIKQIRGASRLRVGRSRPLKGKAFVIEQDHNELVLTFRRQRLLPTPTRADARHTRWLKADPHGRRHCGPRRAVPRQQSAPGRAEVP